MKGPKRIYSTPRIEEWTVAGLTARYASPAAVLRRDFAGFIRELALRSLLISHAPKDASPSRRGSSTLV
jgi:hypothetical protein